jgi:hypothetical protein
MKSKLIVLVMGLMTTGILLAIAPIACSEGLDPQPDLTILSVNHYYAGSMKDWHWAEVTVKNIGDWPADKGFTTIIVLNDLAGHFARKLTEYVHPGLPDGRTKVVLYLFQLSNTPPRQYTISAYTDWYDVIDESNEGNNGWVESAPFWA